MSGVKYIDLENNDFSPSGVPVITIKGVFNAVKSTRKRIVLTNFSVDSAKYHDIECSVIPHGFDEFHISYATDTGTNYFSIKSNDQINLNRG